MGNASEKGAGRRRTEPRKLDDRRLATIIIVDTIRNAHGNPGADIVAQLRQMQEALTAEEGVGVVREMIVDYLRPGALAHLGIPRANANVSPRGLTAAMASRIGDFLSGSPQDQAKFIEMVAHLSQGPK